MAAGTMLLEAFAVIDIDFAHLIESERSHIFYFAFSNFKKAPKIVRCATPLHALTKM